jgi:hypothetical protein
MCPLLLPLDKAGLVVVVTGVATLDVVAVVITIMVDVAVVVTDCFHI